MTTGEGAVTGAPNLILRAEGAAVLMAVVWAYALGDGGWWMFALLLLMPDLFMLGYLAGPRAGAAAYNLGHTYLVPLGLLALGQAAGASLATSLGLVWAAHIGLDRMLGYGLKYPWAFGATHLTGAPTVRAAAPATPSGRA